GQERLRRTVWRTASGPRHSGTHQEAAGRRHPVRSPDPRWTRQGRAEGRQDRLRHHPRQARGGEGGGRGNGLLLIGPNEKGPGIAPGPFLFALGTAFSGDDPERPTAWPRWR